MSPLPRSRFAVGFTGAFAALLSALAAASPAPRAGASVLEGNAVRSAGSARPPAVAKLVWFEENRGQSAPEVRALGRAAGVLALLTDDGAVVRRAGGAFAFRFTDDGASPVAQRAVTTTLPLEGRSNYLVGSDPSAWVLGVPHHAGALQRGVAPGIDVRWTGEDRSLRFDVEVAPGTDAAAFRVRIDGAERAAIDDAGRLVVETRGARTEVSAPVAWQELAGVRRSVAARWAARGEGAFGFAVEGRDPAARLVIDPTIHAGSYLGSNRLDQASAIDTDIDGNLYIAGATLSSAFPAQPTTGTAEVLQPVYSAASGTPEFETQNDGFVAKLSPTTQTVAWCTFLGGTDDDSIQDLAVDPEGDLVVCGRTVGTTFPLTEGALATTGGGFLAKLSGDGTDLLASTRLGRGARCVAADASGGLFVLSDGAPGLVTHYDAAITKSVWSDSFTTTTGSVEARNMCLDSAGNPWVIGTTDSEDVQFPSSGTTGYLAPYDTSFNGGGFDAIFWKLDGAAGTRVFTSYFGGNGDEYAEDIAVDGTGAVVICGLTSTTESFPLSSPVQSTNRGNGEGFLTRFNAPGTTSTTISWSTYFGGNSSDLPRAVSVNVVGDVYLAGETFSTQFFPLSSAIQSTNAGSSDGFLAKISAGGSLRWSTYIGGNGADALRDLVVGPTGRPAATGQTLSTNFPTKTAAQGTSGGAGDAFVWALEESTVPFGSVRPYELSADPVYHGATEGFPWNVSALKLPIQGGRTPLTWKLQAGTLPSGITLSTAGVLSGTPPLGSAGTYTFSCSAVDTDGAVILREYSMQVFRQPAITTSFLKDWTAGEVVSEVVQVAHGAPPHTWVAEDPASMPPDLVVEAATGRVHGTIVSPGNHEFTVRVTDVNGASHTRKLSLHVNERPFVNELELPEGTETRYFAATFSGQLGTLPYTWSISSGTSPMAAPIGADTGYLAGNLLAAGDYTFTVELRDAAGALASREFQVHVNALPVVLTTELPPALDARPYRGRLHSDFGTGTHVWSLTGQGVLPPGLVLDGAGGIVSGTPSAAGEYTFEMRATDTNSGEGRGHVDLSVVPFFALSSKANVAKDVFAPEAGPTRRYLELLAGTRLDGTVRLVGKGKLAVRLRLVDVDTGEELDLTKNLKKKGAKTLALSKLVVDRDRRLFVLVEPDPGFQGTVKTQLAAKARTGWSGTVSVDPAGAPVPVTFSAVRGARLTVKVARAKGSLALPTIVGVTDEDGNELLGVARLKPTRTGATLQVPTGLPAGKVTVTFAGLTPAPSGACTWKATLKGGKRYDVALVGREAGDAEEEEEEDE